MKIKPSELLNLHSLMTARENNMTSTAAGRQAELAAGKLNDYVQKVRENVSKVCEDMLNMKHATPEAHDLIVSCVEAVRKVLDERPSADEDPELAIRFPSMFKGSIPKGVVPRGSDL